eukprot:6002362-Pyramimonas_sp.AAC.1
MTSPGPHSSRPSVLTFHTLALREALSFLAFPEAFNRFNASPSAPSAEVGRSGRMRARVGGL